MDTIPFIFISFLGLIGSGQTHSRPLHVRRALYFEPVWQSKGFSIGSGTFSIWTPLTVIQGYYPLGDALSSDAGKPSRTQSLLVFDADDGVLSPPVDIKMESSYGFTQEKNKCGLTLFKLIAPSGFECLGYVAKLGHYSHRNFSVDEFQNYRCVHSDYAMEGRSIQKEVAIIDGYDPNNKDYARTTLWRVNSAVSATDDIQAETFISELVTRDAPDPVNYHVLNPSSLTFSNPQYNPSSPLLVYETSVFPVNSTKGLQIGFSNLGVSVTADQDGDVLAFTAVENPNYVNSSDYITPLSEPVDFVTFYDCDMHVKRPICPPSYVSLGDFVFLGPDMKLDDVHCVHENYITFGKWTEIDLWTHDEDNRPLFKLWKAEPLDKTNSMSIATIFMDEKQPEFRAPLLQTDSVTVASARDIAKIAVANDPEIFAAMWKGIASSEQQLIDWKGRSTSHNCDATTLKFVTNINESIVNTAELRINYPIESHFKFDFGDLDICDEEPAAANAQHWFKVMTDNEITTMFSVNHDVAVDTYVDYRLEGVRSTFLATKTFEATVQYVDHSEEIIKLDIDIKRKLLGDLTVQPISHPCRIAHADTMVSSSPLTFASSTTVWLCLNLIILRFSLYF